MDGFKFGSSEATDMMVGEFAGEPVLLPAFPAAAMMRQPLRNAAAPALVYAAWTGLWLPSDIEMTWQRLAIAQFMPASTLAPVPLPELVSTLPTKMWTPNAMPYRGVVPAGAFGPQAVPMQWVP